MIRTIFTFFLFSIFLIGKAQDNWEETRSKIGVKTGINLSQLTGTELQNPSLKFGYVAGVYVKSQGDENFIIQAEALGSYRGSKFKNDIGEYNKVTLFYVDVSLLPGFQFGEDNNQAVILGPSLSYLGLSSAFIQGQQKSFKNKLELNPWDINAAVYYQMFTEYVGFQFGVKKGLSDINNGLNFVDVKPDTGFGGIIQSLSFEISMLF